MREKVERHVDGREVVYDEARWELLESLRTRASALQRAIPTRSMVYGSLARGDVHPASDIDVVVVDPLDSFQVELGVADAFHITERRLTIASPGSVPKANIHLVDGATVSWPLLPPSEREEAFYAFGGWMDVASSGPRERAPGVSKRLLLIEPGDRGHVESSVVGAEVEVARRLDVPMEIVIERVRVLRRRDRIGRTGVFRSVALEEGQSFEQLLDRMADTTPAVRRQLRRRGSR